MNHDCVRGHRGSRRAKVLTIGVVVMAIAGYMVWTGQQVGGMRVLSADHARRLDVLEQAGSPAVAQVRMLQMQALQSIEQRRIDALQATHTMLKERLEALTRSADAMREQVDHRD